MKTFLHSKMRLLDYFDDFTLQKGTAYFRDQRVYSVDAKGVNIRGMVKGSASRTYGTQLVLREDGSLKRTSCTCPVGYDCKHAAAVMIAFLRDVPADYIFMHENVSFAPSQVSSDQAMPAADSPEAELAAILPGGEVQRALREVLEAREFENASKDVYVGQTNIGPLYKPKTRVVYVVSTNLKPHPISQLEAGTVGLHKDGSFGAFRALHLSNFTSTNVPAYATREDVEVTALWSLAAGNAWYPSRLAGFPPELVNAVVTRVLSTNRCYFETAGGAPLRPGAARQGVVCWRRIERDKYILEVSVAPGDSSVHCLRWGAPWYVDEKTNECGPIEIGLGEAVLSQLFEIRAVGETEARGLPLMLADMGLSDIIPPPPCANPLILNLVPSTPALTVELVAPSTDASGAKFPAVVLTFERAMERVYKDDDGKLTVDRCDKRSEALASQRLIELGMEQRNADFFGKPGDTLFYWFQDSSKWLDFASCELTKLREAGWRISDKSELALRPVELTDENLDFQVKDDGNWWFSLALHIDVGGKKIPLLPLLLAALRQLPVSANIAASVELLNRDGKFYSYLSDGKLISLPFERVRSIITSLQEMIARAGTNSSVKTSVLHLNEMLGDESMFHSRWTGAERVLELAARLRRLVQPCEMAPPAMLVAELRPYQIMGMRWLQKVAAEKFGGILADDMGLGKTIQLLAHVCLEKEAGRMKSPFLVVCPTSVLPNWVAETRKFAPDLRILAYRGGDRSRHNEQLDQFDIVVTTYPLLTRDADEMQNRQWHGVALDEAQAIKNANTRVARAVRGLQAEHRFCLTGTPVENHLGELWSHFQFLMPGLLGDQQTFNSCLRYPIEKEGDLSRKAALAARVRPFLLRRTKKDVATELPDRTVIIQYVELEGDQRDLYETVRLASTKQVRDEIQKKGFKQSQIMILDALLKLRQVCCDPRLVKLSAASKVKESAKLDMLTEMIEQLVEDGRRILLFSQFTSMLDLVEQALIEREIRFVQLRGDTRDRALPVQQFQSGEFPVFLLSLKAGGVGLNLTAADVVIHYDPWWNPAVEEQATDRAHRIGQTKQVFVYKLIARGTIEQRMLDLQDRKRSLAGSIYDESADLSGAFTEADLTALLNPIDDYQ
ncbi:MAG: DEAD/DEAH box helicase [Candidatus Obscuribacterales bacterium]|nr:DEAD/DEAH box helicase [Candidatus Obscuribacterales bacterium]